MTGLFIRLGGRMMTIQIIGGGSVGLLMASFLAEKGFAVTIISTRVEQRERIETFGLTRQNIGGEKQRFPAAAADKISGHTDLVIVAVKYNGLSDFYPLLAELPISTPLLFLQNGLAHYEEAMRLPQQHIAFGSAQFGAQRENDTTVIHRGIGVLKLAVGRGDIERFSPVLALDSDMIPISTENEAETMLLEKALLNCFINPLTAILNVKNGELLTNQHAYALLKTLYTELMTAFPHMRDEFPFEGVKKLCEKTAANTSSMLSDRQAGRKTEVDTIVGAIIKKAALSGRQLPTLHTLYELIKAAEQLESGDKV